MSRQLCCRMLQIGQMLKVVMQAYNSVQKEAQEAEVQTPEHYRKKKENPLDLLPEFGRVE